MYAVCKDNTVYAYSTAHLMLGHAPELEDFATKLSGIRVLDTLPTCLQLEVPSLLLCSSPRMSVTYVPPALSAPTFSDPPGSTITPSRSFSSSFGPEPASSTIPIFRIGTPLVHGHSSEVTNVNWTHDGKLVSASDDYVVRQWQEDDARARHYRQVGDFGGERHMAGWADVGEDWDAEDDE
ncbi:hypothetical protein NM208_g13308 [Fusarium decemcellulare]|uniref:Uncharacterized protein n=1 Tax=Fusarium decemcellulare TaxID=57161 RepID=A0ACC1RMV5_9HYPO|nr:hypothetical protein NM208_g13308 [Fusarium decemcellulare]